MITLKGSRKKMRRQQQLVAESQINRIAALLGDFRKENETPAQAVKRLLDEHARLASAVTVLKS